MPSDLQRTSPALEPASCGLCGGVEAEPVAVGQDFRNPADRDTYLAVRCSGCGLIYLTPAPSATLTPHGRPGGTAPLAGPLGTSARGAVRGAVRRWFREMPPTGRILASGDDAATICREAGIRAEAVDFGAESLDANDHDLTSGSARGAVLLGWLERVPAPAAALRVVWAQLGPGARALVVSSNPGSAVANVFHGRHWAGYDFPRSRALADRATLATLADQGGFTIAAVWTIGDPGAWTVSWGDLLRDWDAPAWIARALGPGSPLAASGARLLEWISVRRGRGGLLVADLRWAPTVPANP